jgi:hypothetical protein
MFEVEPICPAQEAVHERPGQVGDLQALRELRLQLVEAVLSRRELEIALEECPGQNPILEAVGQEQLRRRVFDA